MAAGKAKLRMVFADLLGAGVCVVASAALAFGVNAVREDPLPIRYQTPEERVLAAASVERAGSVVPNVGRSENEGGPVSLEELRALVGEKSAVILDARPEIFWRLGHIPGAISLPREDFGKRMPEVRPVIDSREGPIVVYCAGGHCKDAEMVISGLREAGFAAVRLFPGGWDAWEREGLPAEEGR